MCDIKFEYERELKDISRALNIVKTKTLDIQQITNALAKNGNIIVVDVNIVKKIINNLIKNDYLKRGKTHYRLTVKSELAIKQFESLQKRGITWG